MPRAARLSLCLLLWTVLPAAAAGLRLDTRLDSLAGSGWEARGIVAAAHWTGPQAAVTLDVERLTLPGATAAPLVLTGLHVACPEAAVAAVIACPKGRLRVADFRGEALAGTLSFTYDQTHGGVDFTLEDLPLAGGRVAAAGRIGQRGWELRLTSPAVDAAALARLLQALLGWPLEGLNGRGRLSLNVVLSGRGGALDLARIQATGRGLTFSAGGGRYAAEGLGARLDGHWHFDAPGGRFTAELRLSGGQLYLEPLFFDPAAQGAVAVRADGRLAGDRLRLDNLRLSQQGVVQASGAVGLRFTGGEVLESLDLRVAEARFPAAYAIYLQPFLPGTVAGDLQTGGRLAGEVKMTRQGVQSLAFDLAGLDLEDAAGRFGVTGLDGRLAWRRDAAAQSSTLRWDAGHLYRVGLGGGGLALESAGFAFRLPQRTRIPLLDGAVVIHRLEGQGLDKALRWQFDGRVEPVSLAALSAALDWPRLAGTLAGEIPNVRYADAVLEVGGALRVQVFDGEIAVRNLRVEQPLGLAPKVFADLALRGLDLLALTRTFDFGRIEGRLEGHVHNLRMENWQPVAFEAAFASPARERTRRVISQRAVENLSSLGGGGGAAEALSRGFLSFFDEFNYKRLGIRCRLADGVCEMGGVAPARDGYYLVEGEGLPRIDVIGYNRRVDWRELLARLRAAARSEGPVIR